MKIKLVFSLLLLLIISAPSASALTTGDIIEFVSQKLSIYPVDDYGWIQTVECPDEVQPGATLNVITVINNPSTLPDQVFTIKLQLVDDTGTILDETTPFDLSSGNTATKTLTSAAPIAQGTYQYQVLRSVWDSYAGTWMAPSGPESFPVTVTASAPASTPVVPGITTPSNQPPNAVIIWESYPNGKVRVSGLRSTDDDRIVKYRFYVDGEPFAAAAYVDVMGVPGDIKKVRLVVTDSNGATDEATITLVFSGTASDVSVKEASADYISITEQDDKPPIYFEDGALKIPGFSVFLSLLAVLCIATFRSKK